MAEFRYGPVELYLVGLEGDRPAPGVMEALVHLVEGGLARLLDFVILTKADDGTLSITEVENHTEEYGLGAIEFGEFGIAGDADIEELAELIDPGTSAAIVAFELSYVRLLADELVASGAVVLASERIPAHVVNALVKAAHEEQAHAGQELEEQEEGE